MAPFCCNGTRTILSNQVLGSQNSYLEMNDRAPKIAKDSKEKDNLSSDILVWLRTAASDPCQQNPTLEKLRRRQILKAREHISVSTTEFPWKKRKLDLLQNKNAISPPLAKPKEQSNFASSVSCSIDISTEGSQQCLCQPSISLGSSRYRGDISRKRVQDDSVSVASTSEKEIFQNIVNQSLKESNNRPLKRVCMPQAKITNKNFSPLSDSVDSVDNSSMSTENSQEKHKTARRSPRLQNFIGDYLPRTEVPVGTRHQADIPNYIEPRKSDNSSDGQSDSLDYSASMSTERSQEKHKTVRRSPRLHNFIGDYLPRTEVPVATRHQADIPDYIEPRKSDNSLDSSASMSTERSQEKHKTARRSPRLQNFTGDYLPRTEVPVGACHRADIPDCIAPRKSDNSSVNGQSDSLDSSASMSSENSQEKHENTRRSPRFQNFTGDYLPRIEVPVGTRHHADIPDYIAARKVDNSSANGQSDSSDSSASMSTERSQEKYKTARRSPRFQNFIGDCLPRIEVPVGKRHQADIPDYIGPMKNDNFSATGQSDSSDSRYLGTKIWPIEGKSTEDSKEEGIGKGRSDSCSSNGCGSCIKLHVFKKGLQLREDLGTAFFTWKFDEMGEEVAKSWTAAEQQCFETLVETDPLSQTDNFLEPALKRFSGKCKKSILSYYFNVFVLRRLIKQTRLAAKLVNTDNEDDVSGNTKYLSGGH
ncbi:hypothetical protein MKW94_014317 [Papaver nudicaule]|uniref:ELM2 domain-containing protein n=1 Tax=Papaver nudicaule TaxID=74823 RepID=A0AA41UTL6_PAPNU|nr:hypothetical protein [Papaver nudicaule]MCL7032663.1 hypothetical protein [Papaver nudicaule]